MEPNKYSSRRPPRRPDGLAALAAAVDELAARDLDGLPDTVVAEQVLALRRLVDRLEGQWLKTLAAVDARGAAGAEQDQQVGSTAGWLRIRLRLSPGTAAASVRTARALFRGPLPQTAQALGEGAISAAHASVVAHGTSDLPDHVRAEADPVLVEAARRLDPPQLRRVTAHLRLVTDPEGADAAAQRRHARRGLWLTPTLDQLVAIDGLLEPEAGQIVLAALEPLARPADAHDARNGSQRTADALTELARRALEAGRLPTTGGVRPQLTVTVDLDSLLGHPGSVGGDLGGLGPLAPVACRRLACDGTVTRVLVTRHPTNQHSTGQQHPTSQLDSHQHSTGQPHGQPDDRDDRPDPAGGQDDHTGPAGDQPHPGCCPNPQAGPVLPNPNDAKGLGEWLRAAMARLPPTLGGAPSQPLDVGRTTRVVSPAQRSALAVRDRGCGFPGCSRPLVWCEAHRLWHWLDGGPTDLTNLVLVCRAHHRAVHEGGWQLIRGPDGRVTATPPYRRHPGARRHPPAA